MIDEPTIKISQEEYRALTSIAITAEQYLRSGSLELGEELRDAVLLTKAFSRDDEENVAKITLSETVVTWLEESMSVFADTQNPHDAKMSQEVLKAISSSASL